MLYKGALRKAFFAIILGLFILAAGCGKNSDYGTNTGGGGGGNPPANQVYEQNTAFNPASMTVSTGTQVKWTNKDGFAHTVTSGTVGSPNGIFDSGNMGSGGTFTYTFNNAGTFKYYCRIHGSMMTGTIVVQ